ncbi:MAG TPA: lipoyl(octanoyl) transferase LipB [Gemmatimonadota bacterium]|nr:lipoyl(octanoyl) transferase LipB [Gemmatimonadota bacterium]
MVQLPGLTDYGEALELQRSLARARVAGQLADDVLLLLEHPKVITLGRGASEANVLLPPELLANRGVKLHEIERGGDVTYHGPGQLVGYPIIDLTRHRQDLHWYLRQLEEVLMRALRAYQIEGRRVPGYTGVWVEDRKIASIGVHVTRWVTFHGFALNVSTDLADFDLIVPCGIEAVKMTSVEKETGAGRSVTQVGDEVARCFGEVFDLAMTPSGLPSLS